jgi:hypothetical protein
MRCVVLLLCLALAASVGSAAPEAKELPLPSLERVYRPEVQRLEVELAALLRERDRLLASGSPRATRDAVALQIDLRLLRRHLLRVAVREGPGKRDGQVAVLRAADLAVLIAAADAATTVALDGSAEAIGKRTFLLVEPEPPETDVLLTDLGRMTLRALQHPAGAAQLPQMRPALPAEPTRPTRPERPMTSVNSMDDVAQRVRALPISLELRQQLDGLLDAVRSDRDTEPAARTAAAVAEALAGNVAGMSSDERRVAENQLVDALALYRDIRLRDAGLNKLRQLERLGTVASAAGGDAATAREVAPLLATARREAELSDQLLDVVARYTAQKERRAALPSAADLRSRGLDANAARAVQSVEAAYARKQAQFVDDARSFAASRENPGGSRMMSASVDDVVANVRDLTRLNDLTEQAVAALPADVRQAEARLRVSPNGLKQAVTRALLVAVQPGDTDERQQASRIVAAAAEAVRALAANDDLKAKASELPVAAFADYPLARTLPTRHLNVASQLAGTVTAGNVDQDSLRAARRSLRSAEQVIEHLREGIEIGASLAAAARSAEAMADLDVDVEALQAMYEPYRAALAKAVTEAGSVSNASRDVRDESRRMQPITELIKRLARLDADASADRDPLVAAAARLQTRTPDGADWADARLLSAATPAWIAVRLDPAAGREALDQILEVMAH